MYRAIQLVEVIRVDESRPMQEPPASAVFYLAEVRRGATYDMLIEGEREDMGASLEVALLTKGASAEALRTTSKYTVRQRGAGLRPKTGDAIFAMTAEQVMQAYETTDQPVPIQLVFRTIPGRTITRKKLPQARVIVDRELKLIEDESEAFTFDKTGRYFVRAISMPNGVVMKWKGKALCDPTTDGPENRKIESQCEVSKGAVLTVKNWTKYYTGDAETVSVRIVKLPRSP